MKSFGGPVVLFFLEDLLVQVPKLFVPFRLACCLGFFRAMAGWIDVSSEIGRLLQTKMVFPRFAPSNKPKEAVIGISNTPLPSTTPRPGDHQAKKFMPQTPSVDLRLVVADSRGALSHAYAIAKFLDMTGKSQQVLKVFLL